MTVFGSNDSSSQKFSLKNIFSKFNFQVAVKIINKEKARKDPYVYKNLRREGRLLQRGHHKHVITIYDTLGKSQFYF